MPSRLEPWAGMGGSASFCINRVLVSPWYVFPSLGIVYTGYRCIRSLPLCTLETPLSGPPRTSWLFGALKEVTNNLDAGIIYEKWVAEYGLVFRIPGPLGSTCVVLADPQAISHFYAHETWTYLNNNLLKTVNKGLFGGGLVYAEGDEHSKQRAALAPAFGDASVRKFTDVFYDCVYKLKTNWDNSLSSTDSMLVDVEKWMNNVALDAIGITGFAYNFSSLSGTPCEIAEVFEAMAHVKIDLFTIIGVFLGNMYPTLWKHLPNDVRYHQERFKSIMDTIGLTLIENSRKEMERSGEKGGENRRESIMGYLLKSEAALEMSHEEFLSQMRFLLVAGYETTSINLTWALIELARNPEAQTRLRDELRKEFPTSDPTWEQLSSTTALRYLDAVVHENLRLHTALPVTDRVAAEEDVIPLSEPLRTPDGELVDHVVIAAGQQVMVPTQFINTSTAYWGEDAREFRPERWLAADGIPEKAREIEGHRHLLTFTAGNRMCLGRAYALVELKAVLGVLVKNYVFELPDGPDTPIELCRGILLRPRVVGEKGASVTMRVRRFTGLE